MKNLKITPDVSIKIALQLIKKNGAKALVIVDKNNKLLGSLSDGDIRNAILKNISLNKKIENIFNRKPKYLIQGKYSKKNLNDLIRKNNFTIIPVIDDFKKVKEIFTLKSFSKNKTRKNNKKNILKKIPCIIMAGGKGTRLQPFTDVLPKPLIPIKKQTVIERIINNFTDYGVNKFLISINYKAEILKAYFKELKPKYKLKFITENKPLGTVGSLSKLSKKEGKYFFITNCDTISNVNLGNMYNFHIKNNYDVTLLTSSKIHQVPYGVCHVAKNGDLVVCLGEVRFVIYDDRLSSKEKPVFSEITLSREKFYRLTIPPQVWLGFQGIDDMNMILNIADIKHNALEVDRKKQSEINYEWD